MNLFLEYVEENRDLRSALDETLADLGAEQARAGSLQADNRRLAIDLSAAESEAKLLRPVEEKLMVAEKRFAYWKERANNYETASKNWEGHYHAAVDRTEKLKRDLAGAKDHLNSDSELGKKYRAEIDDLKTQVSVIQKSIDILKTHASNLKATSDRWRENADNWKRNYYSVNREYTELRKQKAPKPGSTVNLTVNVDTEDALAKINELLEVAKKIERANNPPLYGAFMPSDT